MKRRQIGLFVSFGLSAAILVYVFSALDWALFFQELQKVRLIYLPLIVLLFLLSFAIRAVRWRILFPNSHELSTMKLFEATCVGMMATFVLPLRAGEFVRPWVLTRWQPVKFSTAFASIVTERVFDVVTLLVFLGLCLSRIDSVPEPVILGARALGILAFLIVVVMLIAYWRASLLVSFARAILHKIFGEKSVFAAKVLVMLDEFLFGLRGISSPKELVLVLVWSFLLWLQVAFAYQVSIWAFGEFPSFWVGMTTNVLVAIAVAAPSAPGFVGTYQLGCLLALTNIFGYPKEFAIAYSIVTQFMNLALTVISGFVVLHLEGLTFKELKTSE